MWSVDRLITDVITTEGGYVNHVNDRGGPTKYGITIHTLSAWRGRPCRALDVELLEEAEAREIYLYNYYKLPSIDTLPEPLQPVLFDMAVNHGPWSAVVMLQEVLNTLHSPCAVDGRIGPLTRKASADALLKHGQQVVLSHLVERRELFYRRIVEYDPTQECFLDGWLNRAKTFSPLPDSGSLPSSAS